MHFPDFSSLGSSKFIKTEEGKGQIVAVQSLLVRLCFTVKQVNKLALRYIYNRFEQLDGLCTR